MPSFEFPVCAEQPGPQEDASRSDQEHATQNMKEKNRTKTSSKAIINVTDARVNE